jgi:hypothetical protein
MLRFSPPFTCDLAIEGVAIVPAAASTWTHNEVLVRRTEPLLGVSDERHTVAADALLGRLTTAFFVRLGQCLSTLELGEHASRELLGPGVPPDNDITTTVLDVERVASNDAAHVYRFEATRSNDICGGTLVFDTKGTLLHVKVVSYGQRSSNDSQEFERRLHAADPVETYRVSQVAILESKVT